MVKNTHTLRTNAQKRGLGLMVSGSYVASGFETVAYDRFVKTDVSTLKFENVSDTFALVSGDKGSVFRRVEARTAQGDWLRFAARDGEQAGIVAVELFAKCEVLTSQDIAKRALERGESAQIIRVNKTLKSEHAAKMHVFVLGDAKALYYSGVYAINGKLAIKDCETRRNSHNAKELVAFGGLTEDEKTALSADVAKLAGVKLADASKTGKTGKTAKGKGKGK